MERRHHRCGGEELARARALKHVSATPSSTTSPRAISRYAICNYKGKAWTVSSHGAGLVTAEKFGNRQTKKTSLRVNGVVKQDSTTADIIFPVDAIIESLLRGMTLSPRHHFHRNPEGRAEAVFRQISRDGDLVEAEVEDRSLAESCYHGSPRIVRTVALFPLWLVRCPRASPARRTIVCPWSHRPVPSEALGSALRYIESTIPVRGLFARIKIKNIVECVPTSAKGATRQRWLKFSPPLRASDRCLHPRSALDPTTTARQ